MIKKIIMGILITTVVGASVAAIIHQSTNKEADAVVSETVSLQSQDSNGNQAGQQNTGEPWQETGSIAEIDDYGFTLTDLKGESIYIELGPPDYWQNQGVILETGQDVVVDGTINGDTVHAAVVTLADGQTLQLRSESGQPLWSGGAGNGENTAKTQVSVDEWITLEGTLTALQGGNMTMETTDGEVISFKTGQPRFFTSQNVYLQSGDEIKVLGFYQGDQFMAGEITQVSTGARVMLRDPNGRPLWAGPGNNGGNGNGSGNGNGGGNGYGRGGGKSSEG